MFCRPTALQAASLATQLIVNKKTMFLLLGWDLVVSSFSSLVVSFLSNPGKKVFFTPWDTLIFLLLCGIASRNYERGSCFVGVNQICLFYKWDQLIYVRGWIPNISASSAPRWPPELRIKRRCIRGVQGWCGLTIFPYFECQQKCSSDTRGETQEGGN